MRQVNSLGLFSAALLLMLGLSGCKSNWIDATIENRTGQNIRELEVDYPSASFGANALASGATMYYRFQVRGSGPVKLDYAQAGGKACHAQGLTLTEQQHGSLWIRLLPAGKVEFVPNLQPAS